MPLRGQTQDFGLADAIQLIVQSGKSGALRCVSNEETVVFGVDAAFVNRVETEGRPTGARLGNRLVGAGVLTREELGRVLVRRARNQEPVESLVVELGLADPQTVQHHVTLLGTDSLLEIFLWADGTYELIEGGAPEPNPWIIPISLEELLVMGIPLVHEWPTIAEAIPSAKMRIAERRMIPDVLISSSFDSASELMFVGDDAGGANGLGDNERLVHGLCEPGLDVQTVLDRSPFHRLETCRCLNALLGQQLLSLRPP